MVEADIAKAAFVVCVDDEDVGTWWWLSSVLSLVPNLSPVIFINESNKSVEFSYTKLYNMAISAS